MTPGARNDEVISLADVQGGRLLASDIRLTFILANELRYRALTAVGIPREQANLATFVGALMLADRAGRLFKGPPGPSRADMLIGTAVARESLRAVAGQPAADAPLFGTLLTFALVAKPARRAIGQAVHGVTGSMSRSNDRFRRRYGYLVDPGHVRARLAERRRAAREPTR